MRTGLIQRVYESHICGETLQSRTLKVSDKMEMSVNYCPKCEVYIWHWGAEDRNGISSGDQKKVIEYILASQEIIRQKHLENISQTNI